MPLLQRMVLLKSAGPVAEAFYAYIQEPAARAIMERYGFVLPGVTVWTGRRSCCRCGWRAGRW